MIKVERLKVEMFFNNSTIQLVCPLSTSQQFKGTIMAENLMNIMQVAEYLQMNKMTIYKLAREGKLPSFRVASEWRFRKDLIDRWLLSQLKTKITVEDTVSTAESGITILIVDDEEAIRDYFSRALKKYRILTSSSGEEAVDMVRKEKPGLVLLDLKMPGMSGIETLRQIKAMDRNIAVLMLNAHGTLETNLEAARTGAYGSIAKPLDLNEMMVVVKSALARTTAADYSAHGKKKRKP